MPRDELRNHSFYSFLSSTRNLIILWETKEIEYSVFTVVCFINHNQIQWLNTTTPPPSPMQTDKNVPEDGTSLSTTTLKRTKTSLANSTLLRELSTLWPDAKLHQPPSPLTSNATSTSIKLFASQR